MLLHTLHDLDVDESLAGIRKVKYCKNNTLFCAL